MASPIQDLLKKLLEVSPVQEIKEKPLPQAHFLERHFVHPKLDWVAASQALMAAFPKEAREERPASWYRLLKGTHWKGEIPPGNGPFYIPEWVFSDVELEVKAKALKSAGFKTVVAHVCYLPPDGEYLAAAMRAAEEYPWNVNPLTFRVYIYPRLQGWKKRELRHYTTKLSA